MNTGSLLKNAETQGFFTLTATSPADIILKEKRSQNSAYPHQKSRRIDKMKLLNYQDPSASWKEKGYTLPQYRREKVAAATKKSPSWVHFGAGNIFRAFPAALSQRLLNTGEYDRGIVVCESFYTEII